MKKTKITTHSAVLLDKLGYIPEAGDNETIIYNGYEIKILYMEDNRIKACRIRKLKEKPAEENPQPQSEEKEEN